MWIRCDVCKLTGLGDGFGVEVDSKVGVDSKVDVDSKVGVDSKVDVDSKVGVDSKVDVDSKVGGDSEVGGGFGVGVVGVGVVGLGVGSPQLLPLSKSEHIKAAPTCACSSASQSG